MKHLTVLCTCIWCVCGRGGGIGENEIKSWNAHSAANPDPFTHVHVLYVPDNYVNIHFCTCTTKDLHVLQS